MTISRHVFFFQENWDENEEENDTEEESDNENEIEVENESDDDESDGWMNKITQTDHVVIRF